MTTDTTRYVALLRGINLGQGPPGGHAPAARRCSPPRGHANVRTHLRSGNVVLDSPLGEAELAADLRRAIEKEFGFAVPVVVRTGAEVAAVVADDPFAAVATDPARYLVTFMPEPPGPDRVDAPCRRPRAAATTWSAAGSSTSGCPTVSQNTPLASWKWDRLLGRPGTGPQLEHGHRSSPSWPPSGPLREG